MPKLKILSGQEIIKILQSFGFFIVGQKGSHIKLKRVASSENQTLTIPNHRDLDKGTVRAIYNQAARFISQDELRKNFYVE